MKVSAAICTWNRAKLLDQTLAGMRCLRIPPDVDWELLVVNNNCTDDTDDVLSRHSSSLPLRRLFESQQGQSAARNCAIAAAKGDLILWTDDDVLVDPDWLTEYVRAANVWPGASYFGGTIEPWFEVDPPQWVRRHLHHWLLHGVFVVRESLEPGAIIAGDRYPFGANMGLRRSALASVHFDNRLSRKGNGQVRGEETLLFKELSRRGLEGRWIPSARVRHYVPADRLTTSFLWDFWHGQGIEMARLNPRLLQGRTLFGRPLWCYRSYWPSLIKALLLNPFKSIHWLDAFTSAAKAKGYADEYRRAVRQKCEC